MDFVDVGYSYLMPLLLLGLLIIPSNKKPYLMAIIKSVNVSLAFYFLYQCWDYYNLYKLAAVFGVEITPKGLWLLMQTNKLAAAKNILLLFFPLIFLLKKPSESIIAAICMLLLIWWDVMLAVATKTSYILPIDLYKPLSLSVLKYISLIIALYSFLWLRKKHPFQYSS